MNVAVEHFGQASALFARQYRRYVDLRKDTLLTEGLGKQGAVSHLFADGLDIGLELSVRKALRKQVEALQNRQAGADERHELLIEDEKFLQIQLFTAADGRHGDLRLYGIDQKPLIRKAIADLLFRAGSCSLVMHLAPAIGVFQNVFGHGSGLLDRLVPLRPGGELESEQLVA